MLKYLLVFLYAKFTQLCCVLFYLTFICCCALHKVILYKTKRLIHQTINVHSDKFAYLAYLYKLEFYEPLAYLSKEFGVWKCKSRSVV